MNRVESVADRVRSAVVRSFNQTLKNLENSEVSQFSELVLNSDNFNSSNLSDNCSDLSTILAISMTDVPLKPWQMLVSSGDRIFDDQVFGHRSFSNPALNHSILSYRSAVLLRWRSCLQQYLSLTFKPTVHVTPQAELKAHLPPDQVAMMTRQILEQVTRNVTQALTESTTIAPGQAGELLDFAVSDRLLLAWFNEWRLIPSADLPIALEVLPFPIYQAYARCRSLCSAAVTDGLRSSQVKPSPRTLSDRSSDPFSDLSSDLVTSLERFKAIERSLLYQLVTLTDDFSELVLSHSPPNALTSSLTNSNQRKKRPKSPTQDLLKLAWRLTDLFEQWHCHSRPWEALRQGDRATASDRLALLELIQAILQTLLQDLVTD